MHLATKHASDGAMHVGQIIIGKDVLELLTSAMYIDPLTIYREYIQNSVDAIDEAVAAELYAGRSQPKIEVLLDPQNRTARIRDNGVGIKRSLFRRRLTSLGASAKRGTRARGFRGVGRLCGLAYCQQLVMRTKALDDDVVSELSWDCRQLRERLRDHAFSGDLSELVNRAASMTSRPCKGFPEHFFEVELVNVVRQKNDLLLNEEAVGRFISQVAPVPFDDNFAFGQDISALLREYKISSSYNISVNAVKTFRPHTNEFPLWNGLSDRFTDLESFQIPGMVDGTVAVGWILHHGYYGSLPDRLNVRGLRARIGNIQVGGEAIFEHLFPERRFNAWTVGEVHMLSDRFLIPNGRRDDFEFNNHYSSFQNHLVPIAKKLRSVCRQKSSMRHRERTSSHAIKEQDKSLIQEKDLQDSLAKAPASTRRILQPILESIIQSESKSFSKNDLYALLTEHLLNR
jgi:molecular chaperone HtpG